MAIRKIGSVGANPRQERESAQQNQPVTSPPNPPKENPPSFGNGNASVVPLPPVLAAYANGIAADHLLKEALSNIYLFRDQDGQPQLVTEDKEKRTIISLDKESLSRYFRRQFLTNKSQTLSPSDIEKITSYVQAIAEDDLLPSRPLFTRIGQVGKTIYYNLGGADQKVVCVNESGVTIRRHDMLSVYFKKGGCEQILPDLRVSPKSLLGLLKPFFRVKREEELLLLAVYIVSCFIDINHPILILHGAPGSSKSTTLDIISKIIDPQGSANRLTMSPERRNLVAALSSRYFLGFDNIDSSLHKWQSDLLCTASTGGSEPLRVLYQTNQYQQVNLKGCVCLNGLSVVATEPDLLDRSVLIELDRIPSDKFIPEAEISQSFQNALPSILGAVFNTLTCAIKMFNGINGSPNCRMGEFAKWGYCISDAIVGSGSNFEEEYSRNIESAKKEAKLPLIVDCMQTLMKSQPLWAGTMTELRDAIWSIATQKRFRGIDFPASPSAFSRLLKYHKSLLEQEGITYTQKTTGDRRLEITRTN